MSAGWDERGGGRVHRFCSVRRLWISIWSGTVLIRPEARPRNPKAGPGSLRASTGAIKATPGCLEPAPSLQRRHGTPCVVQCYR